MSSQISNNNGDQMDLATTLLESGLEEMQVGQFCYIDDETVRSLELVENNLEPNNRIHSLFGVLERTKTTSGAKILKHNILRPLAHLQTIEERLDCVQFLVQHPDVLYVIQQSLTKFGNIDLEQLVNELFQFSNTSSRIINVKTVEKRLEILVTLRRTLNWIVGFQEAMSKANQPILNAYSEALEDPNYLSMCELIDEVIRADYLLENKGKKREMINSIKNGIETLLDITRKTYFEALSDMKTYVQSLAEEENLPLKLSFQTGRGYYLYLNKDTLDSNFKMPAKFARVFKTRNIYTFTTTELMRCNVRVNMSYENTFKMSSDLLEKLIVGVTSHSASLYKIIEVVGFIDMIVCFAEIAYNAKERLSKPLFNRTGIEIIGGRHIILETVLGEDRDKIIANDTRLIDHNFALIVGPNMGGKTVYLKQVALIQIMAQMGCFVPAESANLLVHDQIIVRSGSDNEYEATCSSFMNEMKGICCALKKDDLNSLIIIDELGRGTSYEDGSSYSFAIAEDLAMRRNVFTLFATHFPLLRALSENYKNIKIGQFRKKRSQSESLFSHELDENTSEGVCDEDIHYGLKLAESSNLPKEVLTMARNQILLSTR